MSEEKMMRLGQIARKLNVGTATIVESMAKKGFEVENNPNSKISMEQVAMLEKEFKSSALDKEEASHLSIGKRHEPISLEPETPKQEKAPEPTPAPVHKEEPKPAESTPVPPVAAAPAPQPEPEKVAPEAPKLEGIKILGKIDLDKKPAPAPQPAPAPRSERPQEQRKPNPYQQQNQPQNRPDQRPGQHQKGNQQQNRPNPQAPKPAAPAPKPAAPTPPPVVEAPKAPVAPPKEEGVPDQLISAKADSLKGLTVLGKIELPVDRPKKKGGPVASSDERNRDKKRPRKRIDKPGTPGQGGGQGGQPGTPRPPQEQRGAPRPANQRPGGGGGNPQRGGGAPQQRVQKAEPTPKEIQDQIKQTLARLQGTKPTSGKSKSRRDKRADRDRDVEVEGEETKILKVR